MPNPNNFDEASVATQNLFENEQAASEETETTQEQPTVSEEEKSNDSTLGEEAQSLAETTEDNEAQTRQQANETLEQAAQTAEVAAEAAAQKDSQLQQAMQEIEALREQNRQLQGTVDELSVQNKETILDKALSPPTLDVNALAFADEETVKAAQAKYAADMAEYNRKLFLEEFAPVIEQANEAKLNKEKSEVIEALSNLPELNGIEDMLPQLDKIISNNKALASNEIPLDEKYITAYAIAKGVNSINTPPEKPKELSADDMLKLYNENSAFQELVEKQRLEQIKQSQQVPPFSASSGAVNAALNIKEKPQTLEEASKRTREMFGSM